MDERDGKAAALEAVRQALQRGAERREALLAATQSELGATREALNQHQAQLTTARLELEALQRRAEEDTQLREALDAAEGEITSLKSSLATARRISKAAMQTLAMEVTPAAGVARPAAGAGGPIAIERVSPKKAAVITLADRARDAVVERVSRKKATVITLADRARDAGQWEIAAQLYRKALKRNPRNPPIWVQYGHALKENGYLAEAEAAYRTAIEYEPGAPDPRLQLGHLLKVRGKNAQAEATYIRSFNIDPAIADPLNGLGDLGWSEAELEELRCQSAPETAFAPDLPLIGTTGKAEPGSCTTVSEASGPERVVKESDEPNSKHVLVTAEELADIASAIGVDTEQYTYFFKRFGVVLAKSGIKVDVIFVDGGLGSVSTRYRITHLEEGLRELGYGTLYVRTDTTDLKIISNLSAHTVVFFRAPLNDGYQFLVDTFRAKGSRIVFDIDDLVFDETIISSIDGVRYLTCEQRDWYLWDVRHYRSFALEADLVTTSTEYLADYARKTLGCNAIRIRNTIGRSYLRLYSEARICYDRRGLGFVVGYYAGSKTHQMDFREAYTAIVAFMRTYPDVLLRVVGMLELNEFPDLGSLSDRIVTRPMLPYGDMLEDLANCDVIIAPLVAGNPFCEAKSELKFFEAALLGRPCIASATVTYAVATENGRFAYLAKAPEDWFEALSKLYLSPELRSELAMAARAHCLQAFSYRVAGTEAATAYFGPPPVDQLRPVSLPSDNSIGKRSIGVIVPGLIVGGGGHRKIFKFCHDLVRLGYALTLYVDSIDRPERIRQQLKTHFFDFDCDIVNYRYGVVGNHAAIVCTHWLTAYSLRTYETPNRVIYFVQDFEPIFQPAGSAYVKALATYRLGFHIVCYGNWVSERLHREFDLQPITIPLSIDCNIYRPKPTASKVMDILFFARPSQPRRCFELGVEALRLISRANPGLRIGLFGEDRYGDLGFPYHNLKLIADVSKLADMYTKCKIGICFSPTNPSLVGYEMIACGLPIVDIRLPGSETTFGGDRFVYYANPTPESIFDAVSKALIDDLERDRRSAAGIDYASAMPDDRIIAESLITVINSISNSP